MEVEERRMDVSRNTVSKRCECKSEGAEGFAPPRREHETMKT